MKESILKNNKIPDIFFASTDKNNTLVAQLYASRLRKLSIDFL